MPRKPKRTVSTPKSSSETSGSGESELEIKDSHRRQRPDPMFKDLLTRAAHQIGLKSDPTELRVQQASTSDLLLKVAVLAMLVDTIFDFFRFFNIIEFKSWRDALTQAKFEIQMARGHLWRSRNGEVGLDQLLNVIVTAQQPTAFLEFSGERGLVFENTPEREWLYTAQYGWHDVAIVVCEKLPLEPRYAPWLIFAAPYTKKWQQTLLMLAETHNMELLNVAFGLNPKEYNMMFPEIQKVFEQYPPEEQARLNSDLAEVMQDRLPKMTSEERGRVLASLAPQERLAGLAPQERLAGLAPQERLAGLAPQERLAGLALQERLAGIAPQERLAGLAPQERLAGLSEAEREQLLQELLKDAKKPD